MSRHVRISFYLGVLSDDLVHPPLSEHQAIWAQIWVQIYFPWPCKGIDLFGHQFIWTSVCLDQAWHQAIWLRFWSGCLIIGPSDQIWPQQRQVSCHPDKELPWHRSIWLTFHLSIDLAIWTSSYLDIDLSGHQAIWTSGYDLLFLKDNFKIFWHRLSGAQQILDIGMSDHCYGIRSYRRNSFDIVWMTDLGIQFSRDALFENLEGIDI